MLEIQTPGNDDVVRATHVFGDKTLELGYESAGGFKAKLLGRLDD